MVCLTSLINGWQWWTNALSIYSFIKSLIGSFNQSFPTLSLQIHAQDETRKVSEPISSKVKESIIITKNLKRRTIRLDSWNIYFFKYIFIDLVACGATWKKPVFFSRNEDIQSFFRSFRCNLCGRRYIKNYIKKKKNCVDESHGQCSSVLHTFFIFVLIISRRVLYICFNENKTLLTKKVHYEVNCGWFLCALSIKMPVTKRKIKLNFNLNITDSIYTTFHFKLNSWSLKIKLKFEKGIMSVSLVQRQWLVFFQKESVTSLAFSTSFWKMSLVSISFCFY